MDMHENLTTTCDQETAEFMSKALLDHAKEIRRYALTYKEAIFPNPAQDAGRKEKFAANVQRMISGMYSLMLMAKHKGITRFCNREQIEACMDQATEALGIEAGLQVPSFSVLN